ncbi:MAG TPA: hypothetical protein QF499_05015 [Gammaproteobacteria bacterium]|jgi:hypothetical protein|nr:hypothetical protein [Gammaproteobacteria bacterium]MDP7660772.1 hypothetical protein [Gammaproteobacteria bacterium]HJP38480.1 hypothetical protein [Gammaproteobacteria bacterium]
MIAAFSHDLRINVLVRLLRHGNGFSGVHFAPSGEIHAPGIDARDKMRCGQDSGPDGQ